jgi:hypothetical protein
MTARWRTGLVLAVTVAIAAGAGVNVGSADAVYGLLDHYEVCSSDGDYGLITSLSVRDKVYVAEQRDDLVRVLSTSGYQIASIGGTERPGERFKDPIVGTSPAGALYVIDNPLFAPRLFKFAGAFEREFMPDPASPDQRLRAPVGVFGTRPGGRNVASGEVFVADVTLTGLPAIKVYAADGTFSELYSGPSGRGRTVGISAVTGGVAVGKTSDSEAPSQVSLFTATNKPLRYAGSFNAVAHLDGVAGAPDNTWWVLGGASPGFAGLEHYGLGGNFIERVPISGGLYALSVAPDGSIWVARQDGLLRIGRGGGVIPPDQYGHGKCGAPRVRPSVPESQQVTRERALLVDARCSESCTVSAFGTLSVPGGAARTFKLKPAKRRLRAGRRGRLRLELSRKAAAALRHAKARGRDSTAQVTLVAADPGMTKSARSLRLTIG